MTDASMTLIDYWQAHPSLRPLVDAGVVDFAHFDATRRADITLTKSNGTLRGGAVANPMIVVANYVFDSIPHNSFSIRDGELFENLVNVTSQRPDPVFSPDQSVADLT